MVDLPWHGWGIDTSGRSIHVGPLPDRRGIAVYQADGEIRPLAYCTSKLDAKRLLWWLDRLAEAYGYEAKQISEKRENEPKQGDK